MSAPALSLDEALTPYAAFARRAGVELPALLSMLVKNTDALQDALAKLTAASPKSNKSDTTAGDAPLIDALLQTPLDETARKGLLALQNMGESARAHGIADMTLDEINAEIAACRQERALACGC